MCLGTQVPEGDENPVSVLGTSREVRDVPKQRGGGGSAVRRRVRVRERRYDRKRVDQFRFCEEGRSPETCTETRPSEQGETEWTVWGRKKFSPPSLSHTSVKESLRRRHKEREYAGVS